MKYLLSASIFYSALAFGNTQQELVDVNQLKWKNRLLIIWSAHPQQDFDAVMVQFTSEINERDILVFVINDSDMATNKKLGLGSDFFDHVKISFPRDQGRYFLVGKDGGIKNSGEVLDIETIFGEIDRMPMRRQEMKGL